MIPKKDDLGKDDSVYGSQPVGMGCLRITEGIMPGLTPWIGGLSPQYRKTRIMLK